MSRVEIPSYAVNPFVGPSNCCACADECDNVANMQANNSPRPGLTFSMFVPFVGSNLDGEKAGIEMRKRALQKIDTNLSDEVALTGAKETTNFENMAQLNTQSAAVKQAYAKLLYKQDTMYNMRTGYAYRNLGENSSNAIRLKLFGLAAVQATLGAITTVVVTIIRALAVLSFFHFWPCCKKSEVSTGYNFKARFQGWVKDIFRVALSPIIYLLNITAAIFGVICPQQGRKIYGALQMAMYGDVLWGNCLAPAQVKTKTGEARPNPIQDFKAFEEVLAVSKAAPAADPAEGTGS